MSQAPTVSNYCVSYVFGGCCPGSKESGEGETEHCELPSCHHRPHQETWSQVPAWFQRAERHCEYGAWRCTSASGSKRTVDAVQLEYKASAPLPQICSLMRGGIAERGGVRVGHRIIEINGQSVVAMAHEKIVQTLSVSVGEVRAPHAQDGHFHWLLKRTNRWSTQTLQSCLVRFTWRLVAGADYWINTPLHYTFINNSSHWKL